MIERPRGTHVKSGSQRRSTFTEDGRHRLLILSHTEAEKDSEGSGHDNTAENWERELLICLFVHSRKYRTDCDTLLFDADPGQSIMLDPMLFISTS